MQNVCKLVVQLSLEVGEVDKWAGCRDALGLYQEPGREDGKSRQGYNTSSDTSAPIVGGSIGTCSVPAVTVRGGGGSGVSKVGVSRDPAVIAQGLVPQEVRLGGVGLIDASEEIGVVAVAVSVDGTNSCDVRVEFGSRLFSGGRVHRKVEGLLYRSTRSRGQLVSVPTSVFGKASVRLLRIEMRIYGNAYTFGNFVG